MRITTTVMAVCLVLQLGCPGVLAGTFTYKPAPSEPVGSFKGQASVNKIGGLYGNDLSAFLDDKTLDIQRTSEKGKKTIASGAVFKTETKKTSGGMLLSGMWFGKDGQELDELLKANKGATDLVDLKDGSTVGGRLVSCSSDEVVIQSGSENRRIPTSSITAIRSERVFEFSCKLESSENMDLSQPFAAEGKDMTFQSTFDGARTKRWDREQQKTQAKSNPPSEGWSRKKKIVVFTVAALLIATAVAVPIAVAVPAAANRQRRERNQRNAAFAALASNLFTPRQTQPVNNQNRNRNNQNQN